MWWMGVCSVVVGNIMGTRSMIKNLDHDFRLHIHRPANIAIFICVRMTLTSPEPPPSPHGRAKWKGKILKS